MKKLLLLMVALPLFSQQPSLPLPQRPQTTVLDLKEQIADCTISLAGERKYVDALVARIRELEAQLMAGKK
jgi:hypothetical protein